MDTSYSAMKYLTKALLIQAYAMLKFIKKKIANKQTMLRNTINKSQLLGL